MSTKNISRRRFLIGATAAATVSIVPRHVLGGPGNIPPSEVITRAVIGTGGQGMGGHVVKNEDGKTPVMLAACDVDKNHLAAALKKAGDKCEGYSDFRRVLDRKDIDTIHIATPPHWHALVSLSALQAGKDVLCEKPMTRFIHEGRIVADAVKRYGRVFQIGTYGRFGMQNDREKMKLRKLLASGVLGNNGPTVRLVGGFKIKEWSGKINQPPQPVPPELDYNFWLGPAPFKPYFAHRVHGSFRGYWDYDGGGLADMAQHFLDPAQFYLAKDDTSPVEVEAVAPFPAHPDACGLWGRVTLKYADGTTLILESGEWGEPPEDLELWRQGEHAHHLIKWPNGEPVLSAQQRAELAAFPNPDPLVSFQNAVKTRKQAGGNAEAAHRCATIIHLANIAIRTGRKLKYDPVAEQFIGDAEANRFVDVPYRAPWRLEV